MWPLSNNKPFVAMPRFLYITRFDSTDNKCASRLLIAYFNVLCGLFCSGSFSTRPLRMVQISPSPVKPAGYVADYINTTGSFSCSFYVVDSGTESGY